jgi:hypothetical protein
MVRVEAERNENCEIFLKVEWEVVWGMGHSRDEREAFVVVACTFDGCLHLGAACTVGFK